jgi:hypothetical protein
MLERALGLSTPEFVRGHFNHTEAIALFPHLDHLISPGLVLHSPANRASRGLAIHCSPLAELLARRADREKIARISSNSTGTRVTSQNIVCRQ